MRTPPLTPPRRAGLPFAAVTVTSALTLGMSIIIIATGGVVRVTDSGLGCPTWPRCAASSLTTTPALGIHGAIEFGNRMLTGVLTITVIALIVSVLFQRHPAPRIIRRAAWMQLALVVVNAVVGGITVLTGLNPWIVAVHFMAAIGLLSTTTITWHLVREHTQPATRLTDVEPGERRLARTTLAGSTLLVVAGTLATGAGPHSGDTAHHTRIPLPWITVTTVHGIIAAAVTITGLLLLHALGRSHRDTTPTVRARLFVATLLVQAAIGITQALLSLPGWLVVLHLLGASLAWAGAIRLTLDTRPNPRTTQPAISH